jgi:hypothetical protein
MWRGEVARPAKQSFGEFDNEHRQLPVPLRFRGRSPTRRLRPAPTISEHCAIVADCLAALGDSGDMTALSSPGGRHANEERDQRDRTVSSMPGEHGGRRLRLGETEPRALGLPLRWFRTSKPIDLRWVRHPYRWLRSAFRGSTTWSVCPALRGLSAPIIVSRGPSCSSSASSSSSSPCCLSSQSRLSLSTYSANAG